MKPRIWIIVLAVLVCVLLAGGLVHSSPVSAGTGYQWAGSDWVVQETVSGGGYRISAGVPHGNGTPCCCLKLPCVIK